MVRRGDLCLLAMDAAAAVRGRTVVVGATAEDGVQATAEGLAWLNPQPPWRRLPAL